MTPCTYRLTDRQNFIRHQLEKGVAYKMIRDGQKVNRSQRNDYFKRALGEIQSIEKMHFRSCWKWLIFTPLTHWCFLQYLYFKQNKMAGYLKLDYLPRCVGRKGAWIIFIQWFEWRPICGTWLIVILAHAVVANTAYLVKWWHRVITIRLVGQNQGPVVVQE